MVKKLLIISILAFGLIFTGCEQDNSVLEPQAQEVAISSLDVETIQGEAENVVEYTLDAVDQTMDYNEEVIAQSGAPLAKVNGYTWTGEYHIWERTVDQGYFHGEFMTKVQYKNGDEIVKKAGAADYMYSYSSATGTYGFPEDDPDYGVIFDNFLEIEWDGFKTLDYEISATGQYSKENHCVYNGEDAVLNYIVAIDIDSFTMKRAKAHTMSAIGTMTITMDPWMSTIEFDGTEIAHVTIKKNGVIVNEYDLDLTTLVGTFYN